jgi:hypothetical protein
MVSSRLQGLTQEEQELLFEDLYFLTMQELRELSVHFGLSKKGKKAFLIDALKQFLSTGQILHEPQIPSVSRARPRQSIPLAPDSLILKGSYKNDLKTRLFMKSLIGPHFHYTAYGVDWINERWLKGEPPTYEEFARAWQEEYRATQTSKRPPKKEWALINFVQEYQKRHPQASKEETLQAWKDIRALKAQRVKESLQD